MASSIRSKLSMVDSIPKSKMGENVNGCCCCCSVKDESKERVVRRRNVGVNVDIVVNACDDEAIQKSTGNVHRGVEIIIV